MLSLQIYQNRVSCDLGLGGEATLMGYVLCLPLPLSFYYLLRFLATMLMCG